MPYTIRKQKCKQSDGDSGSYVLSYTSKKGKKYNNCHTSKKGAQDQIAAIEGPREMAEEFRQLLKKEIMDVLQEFVVPPVNAFDLGSPSKRWENIYSADLQLSKEGTKGNEVDGTTGSWTIQEGENDLYLLNRKSGKKYRFKLEEII